MMAQLLAVPGLISVRLVHERYGLKVRWVAGVRLRLGAVPFPWWGTPQRPAATGRRWALLGRELLLPGFPCERVTGAAALCLS